MSGSSVVARIQSRDLSNVHFRGWDRLEHCALLRPALPHPLHPAELYRTAAICTAELGWSETAHSTPRMPGPRNRGGSSRRQRRSSSRTSRPELSFSVSHVERLLREGHYTQRLGSTAPVYLAAVIECLTAKILELAGNEARSSGQSRITPESIDMAVHNNSLLSDFFRNTTISQVAPPQ